MSVQTVGFAPATLSAIAQVGHVVTVDAHTFGAIPWQAVVHSVEGVDWYAFDDNGLTTVDCAMSPAHWITEPRAMVVPMGHKIGDGWGVEVNLARLSRGVCLSKAY